jgi:beta-lactamase superfamily II metal-dependent hydrolase
MIRKMLQRISLTFLMVFVIACGVYFSFWLRDFESMKVIFMNVGQGDAILISQGSNQVLIDGGRSGKVVIGQLGKYMPFWDNQIEIF